MNIRSRVGTLGLVILVLFITALGAILRLYFVLQVDFPINDGGMFFQMTNDLLANHFALPVSTSYNTGAYPGPIPFAYTPLGFYLAGLLQTISGLDLLTIFHYLPVVYAIVAIPVFYALSAELLGGGNAALYATLAFVSLLPAYQWLSMGGGIARSPAMLLSLLALWQAVRAFKQRSKLAVICSAFFTGLLGMAHIEILWITVIWIALMPIFLAPDRRGLLTLIAIGVGSALVAAPWYLTVVSQHGISTLLGAAESGSFSFIGSLAVLMIRNLTDEVTFTPLLVFAMLAFVQRLLRRDYLLPAWVLAVAFLAPRSATRGMTVPLAMLVGIAIDEIILPAVNRLVASEGRKKTVVNLITIAFIAYIVIRSAVYSPLYAKFGTNSYDILSIENRQAMQWVKTSTPPDSRFLVLSPYTHWSADQAAEWFPALAMRASINTPQGAEWLPSGTFNRQVSLYNVLRDCTGQELGCLEQATAEFDLDYDYIYISGDLLDASQNISLPMPVAASLLSSPAYVQVYTSGPVSIFQRK